MKKILIIDDERTMCLLLNRYLSKHGFDVQEVYKGKKALELLESYEPDLILCDFRLEDMNGDALLAKIKQRYPHMPVIMVTGYTDSKIIVEVMKLGAFDYVTKPILPNEILETIKKALKAGEEQTPIVAPVAAKSQRPAPQQPERADKYIFGDSITFKNILHQIYLVAPTNYSVIIYGETGVGKEAIAQEIHQKSRRSDKPFVAVDCGALSKELAGSELFGHEKGSFTGAVSQKIGCFEIANGGTIFLDEIANLSYEIQVSLLRVVQERKMRRVGGIKDIDLDVRIIVATNERLWEAGDDNKFREDLFHRFNEFSIAVPPLRERKEDIMVFANHFLKLTNRELGKQIEGFSPDVERVLMKYVWHGNLRELKNVIKRATLLSAGPFIEVGALPLEITSSIKNDTAAPVSIFKQASGSESPQPTNGFHDSKDDDGPIDFGENPLKDASYDAEYDIILKALKQVNFNKSKAAKLLNIDRKTLYNKLKQYQQIIA